MKDKILNKITELFLSKNKEIKPEVATVWINRLYSRYDYQYIDEALEYMIWSDDDWPTLGVAAKLCEDSIDKFLESAWKKKGPMLNKIYALIAAAYGKSLIDIIHSCGPEEIVYRKKFKQILRSKLNEDGRIGVLRESKKEIELDR